MKWIIPTFFAITALASAPGPNSPVAPQTPRLAQFQQVPGLLQPVETVRAVVTRYTPSPDETDDSPRISADGYGVFDGLAACPRRYPFGTLIRIAGMEYRCGDRLHPRFDDRFDIWSFDRATALAWGAPELPVEILHVPSLYDQALPLDGKQGGECVYFIQWFLRQLEDCREVDCEAKPFRGYAGQIEPNADGPEIGRVVLLDYKLGHAAIIVDIRDGQLVLAESNLHLDGRIEVGRKIAPDDAHIRGYYELGG